MEELDNSFSIEPSGRVPGLVSSSPIVQYASDSEEEETDRIRLHNESLSSVLRGMVGDAESPGVDRDCQVEEAFAPPPPANPSANDLVALALKQAGIPVAKEQAPQSLPVVAASSSSVAPPSIPSSLEGLVSFQPSSTAYPVDVVDWRLAEEPRVYAVVDNEGKSWVFRGGPGGNCIRAKASLFSEKVVSGKTLLALTDVARTWQPLLLLFQQLKQPSEPGLLEPEQRKVRRSILSAFLQTQGSTFPEALGGWEVGEDGKSVVVSKLPMLMQEVLEQKRQARPSSPPHAFNFVGKPGSEVEGFLAVVNGDDKNLKPFLD